MKVNGRREKSIQNTIVALMSESIVTLVGFLMPRAIILNYGSAMNGLITSLQQFIQYFSLIEAGLLGAAVFSLYKPLAEKNEETIKDILFSAKKLYRRSGIIYLIVLFCVAIIYPLLIAETGLSYLQIFLIFLLMGLNGATQLLFIGKYKVLLSASQNNRITVLINSVSTCLYSFIMIGASYCGFPILTAVFLAVSAYIIRAIIYYIAVRRLYPQYRYEDTGRTYKFQNQAEVFIQQILTMLVLNSGTLILSFTKTSMEEISIYNTYNMVLTAVFLISNALNTGVSASFGDLIARKDEKKLQNVYREYEALFQIFWSILFSCVIILYQPFMQIYTNDFSDTNYVRPILCILFSILGAGWVIRNQQSVIIVAAGKFKEIQKNSVIEAGLTLILSVIGLLFGGLEGLLIGRIISTFYRIIDFVCFNSKNVVKVKCSFTVKQIIVGFFVIVSLYIISGYIMQIWSVNSILRWIIMAFGTVIVALIISSIMELVMCRDVMLQWTKKIKGII